MVIGCCGGGSNFAGIAFPFVQDKIKKHLKTKVVAVEPAACPTLTRGPYAYDFGDTGKMTPLMKQYTLGHNFVPPGIHAGGLRYHGVARTVAQLVHEEVIDALALYQNPCFKASLHEMRRHPPAPESGHAVCAAVDEAVRCREAGEKKTILFNLSGHGHFDLTAYDSYLRGELQDYDLDEEILKKGRASIPDVQDPA